MTYNVHHGEGVDGVLDLPRIARVIDSVDPDIVALRALESMGWTRANREFLPTSPVVNPRRQIDHILYRPGNRWRVFEVRVLGETVASDDRPVLAVSELLPQAK